MVAVSNDCRSLLVESVKEKDNEDDGHSRMTSTRRCPSFLWQQPGRWIHRVRATTLQGALVTSISFARPTPQARLITMHRSVHLSQACNAADSLLLSHRQGQREPHSRSWIGQSPHKTLLAAAWMAESMVNSQSQHQKK